ncbi:cupin domain-containing protein [Desulfovibrio sp. OttesenSCG-928-O18]|nr:cupin domain-containing protein [Desulfovibrio sp. OttesenSCG-928-O18]
MNNIFSVPDVARKPSGDEFFEDMLTGRGRFRMERVVSYGQTTPKGVWYDQHQDEWVAVVEGEAKIGYPDGTEVTLQKGDTLFLPKGTRHQVTYTSAPCVWIAVFGDELQPK